MTAARQLTAVEGSLQPLEIVLRVIAEGHEHATLGAYARAVAEAPVESAPMSRIAAEVEGSVRAAMKGQDRDAIRTAVEKSVGDAIFRYLLFVRINTATFEIAELEGLRAAAAFYWMGSLLGGPREDELDPDDWAEHQKEQHRCWEAWRGVVASLNLTLMIEDEARVELERRYLGGREALLGDVDEVWERFADQVERLWSLSEVMVPTTEDDVTAEATSAAPDTYDERVAERVQRLADDARISTFERIGEMPRAVAIVERRLLS
jgi:hypothetical protein